MKEWAIHYVKAKDVFLHRLKNYNIHEDLIEFDFGENKEYYLFGKDLNEKIVEKAQMYQKKTIVCEKNDANYEFFSSHFNMLAEIKNFVIIFLTIDKKHKVIINPRAHSMIADPESLKLGLDAIWNA